MLSCSTNRETHVSETSFAKVSLFLQQARWPIRWPRMSFITLQQIPSSPLALQLQQKRGFTKAQQATQLPPPISHRTPILPPPGQREEEGRFLQLQRLVGISFRMTGTAK